MSLSTSGSTRSELALLADPALLQKRMEQLASAEAQANGVLELIGPANEILAIREKANEELTNAKIEADGIRDEAQDVLNSADAQAKEIIADAEAKAQAITEMAEQRETDTISRQTQAQENLAKTEREAARLQDLEEVLNKRDLASAEAQMILTEEETSVLKEKAELSKIREHMNNFLG